MEKKPRTKWRQIILLALGVIVYGAIFIGAFARMNESLFEERSANTALLMEKIAQNAETGIAEQWDNLHWMAGLLPEAKGLTMEALLARLERLRLACPDPIPAAFLIDEQSTCHLSDGSTFRWARPELLRAGDECYISSTEMHLSEDDTPYMFFLHPFERAYEVEGTRFTHAAIGIEMTFMDAFFNTEEFGDDSTAFIIRRTGGQIYRQEKANPISGVFNLLSALERATYSYGGSHEALLADIEAGRADCIRIEYEDGLYYVAYSPMETNDWMALLMIPAERIGTANQGFVFWLAIMMLVVVAGAAAIFLLVIMAGNRRVQAQHAAVNAQLQKAVEAERSANEAKTRFLSSMSHDIRTPMNAITGMTELARRHLDDPDYAENCLKKANLACNHLLTLINDILDISKVESGKMTLNPTVFSLADMATNLVNILYSQAVAKGLNFDMRTHAIEHEMVYADQLRINQVFINLLSNAVKYTPEGGRVAVDLFEQAIEGQPGKVRIRYVVRDTGLGMSEEFQQDMYAAFSRVQDQRTAAIQGTGLGLAIVKQMVDLLGGTIACKSALGRGTRFTVTLDLDVAEKQPELDPLPPKDVLLLDDDLVVLDVSEAMFLSLGLSVRTEADGEAALALLAERPAEIVLFDWELPGRSALLPRIRERAPEARLVASAYGSETIVEAAKSAGVDAILAKPFFPSNVHACLAPLLGVEKAEEHEEQVEQDLAGMHLLLAEDNDLNWEIAEEILGMYEITAERAENGQACVDMLSAAPAGTYDLVLMDIQMPILNGYGAARAIRASELPHLRTIPIIAMTADAFADDIQRCLDAGMDAHIAKPIEIDNLLAALEKQRRAGRHGTPGA